MFFIEVYLKEADGGFIVGCPQDNENHIFAKFSDALDFILDYFEKNGSDDPENHIFAKFSDALDFILDYFEKNGSDDPENYKFADSPKEA